MENGELVIYDPAKLLSGARCVPPCLTQRRFSSSLAAERLLSTRACSDHSLEEATILQQVKHKGPIRALDFSSGKKQLLASGSSDGEVRRFFSRVQRYCCTAC